MNIFTESDVAAMITMSKKAGTAPKRWTKVHINRGAKGTRYDKIAQFIRNNGTRTTVELIQITGWRSQTVSNALSSAVSHGLIEDRWIRKAPRQRHIPRYGLTAKGVDVTDDKGNT